MGSLLEALTSADLRDIIKNDLVSLRWARVVSKTSSLVQVRRFGEDSVFQATSSGVDPEILEVGDSVVLASYGSSATIMSCPAAWGRLNAGGGWKAITNVPAGVTLSSDAGYLVVGPVVHLRGYASATYSTSWLALGTVPPPTVQTYGVGTQFGTVSGGLRVDVGGNLSARLTGGATASRFELNTVGPYVKA